MTRTYGNAVVLNGPNGTLSPDVVLGQGFFYEGAPTQGITLLHELMHYTLRKNDGAIDSAYGIALTKQYPDASSAFQNWLSHDCKNQ